MTTSTLIAVHDQSHIAECRRSSAAIALQQGLNAERASDLAIVVTELATNQLKHAKGGLIILQASGQSRVDVLALDNGPGMANVERCMQDGYSTSGTVGGGLGAVARLSAPFEVFSQPGHGAAILACIDQLPSPISTIAEPIPRRMVAVVGAVSTPFHGERVCGDAFAVRENDVHCCMLVVDGLGHGTFAADAAEKAVSVFDKCWQEPITSVIHSIHVALRSTRGAAVAIGQVEPRAGLIRFCGIGNISGAIFNRSTSRRMVSHNGTAGLRDPKIADFTYPWDPDSVVIMNSDGISSKWDVEPYAGLRAKHPALIAGVLYRDFARGSDDATIVAVRRRQP